MSVTKFPSTRKVRGNPPFLPGSAHAARSIGFSTQSENLGHYSLHSCSEEVFWRSVRQSSISITPRGRDVVKLMFEGEREPFVGRLPLTAIDVMGTPYLDCVLASSQAYAEAMRLDLFLCPAEMALPLLAFYSWKIIDGSNGTCLFAHIPVTTRTYGPLTLALRWKECKLYLTGIDCLRGSERVEGPVRYVFHGSPKIVSLFA